MNTTHELSLLAAQRIYERTLTEAQRKHRLGFVDPLGVRAAPYDGTPWDANGGETSLRARIELAQAHQKEQEAPRDTLNASQTHSEPQIDSGQLPEASDPSEGQWHGHTAAQMTYSALVLMGAGLLCLLGGVVLGAWVAIQCFGL